MLLRHWLNTARSYFAAGPPIYQSVPGSIHTNGNGNGHADPTWTRDPTTRSAKWLAVLSHKRIRFSLIGGLLLLFTLLLLGSGSVSTSTIRIRQEQQTPGPFHACIELTTLSS